MSEPRQEAVLALRADDQTQIWSFTFQQKGFTQQSWALGHTTISKLLSLVCLQLRDLSTGLVIASAYRR